MPFSNFNLTGIYFFLLFLFFFQTQPIWTQTYKPGNQKPDQLKEKQESTKDKEDEPAVQIDVTHEIATDWVWRGQSFGGEYLARRNNASYKEISESPTYIPVARVGHSSGFYFELEANIALKGRTDQDSDGRLQSFPGGREVQGQRFFDRLSSGNVSPDPQGNSIFLDPANNVYGDKCDLTNPTAPLNKCLVNPTRINTYNEKNGMARTDGLFTTIAYQLEAGKFGDFTIGSWWYSKKDRNVRSAWNEIFIWWELPFFQKSLNPTIQSFTQTSYDVGGGYGNQYSTFSISREFFKNNLLQLQFSSSIGYIWVNNNASQKSGINDITTTFRLVYKDYFLSENHVYRYDLYLYDNSRFYYSNSLGNPTAHNLSERDGRTADPSKLFGLVNELVYDSIQASNGSNMAKILLEESYQSQKIPKHLLWFSIGANQSF